MKKFTLVIIVIFLSGCGFTQTECKQDEMESNGKCVYVDAYLQ